MLAWLQLRRKARGLPGVSLNVQNKEKVVRCITAAADQRENIAQLKH
jgi:hypothetical protein